MNWVTQLLQAFGKPLQWWVVVAPWEQAVLVRLGRKARHLTSGMHFRIPFLDRVYLTCVRKRVTAETCMSVMTKDRKVLTLGISIEFSIANLRSMLNGVARPEQTMVAIVRDRIIAVAGSLRSEDLTVDRIATCIDVLDQEQLGIADAKLRILTFAEVRTIRLMQSQDYGSYSRIDENLDEKSAVVS